VLYRTFGKTGKQVSIIGMGGMRFREQDYAHGDYAHAVEVVKAAHNQGVNYFDTAPDYCNQHSESIFGEAFRDMDRSSFFISTKCGLWNASTADGARRMIEQSLTRLGLETIDFYNLWSIKTLEEYREFMKKGGVYEGVVKAKQEGLISHIGFTTHLSGEEIASIAFDGVCEMVTLGYNAINFAYRQKGIEACHEAGLGIATMNPLGGGIIPAHPDYFSFLKKEDRSLAVSALQFILSQNKATLALVGFSTIEEVQENTQAAEHLEPTTPDYLEQMAHYLTTELNTLCTTCGYCDSCPVEIPIPQLLDSYNMYLLSNGDTAKVLSRMQNHWEVTTEQAAACIACGQCESLCTQKLPIIERLAHIAQMTE
jgi:predicted aldo/keto reductase-like oxidoreductase